MIAYSSLNLVLLGLPGSGKTTQAQQLADSYRIPHISTGEMLRVEAETGTALGRQAASSMARGELVSDRLVGGIILQRLDREDCARGFILDGYPRTVDQAALLDGILAELGRVIERVILLRVTDNETTERLRDSESAGDLERGPSEGDFAASAAGPGLESDRDDHDWIAGNREQWRDVVDLYRNRGLLVEVDGGPAVAEVSEALHRAVGAPVGP